MSNKEIMECPICRKPMKIGKLFGSGVLAGGTTNIVWVDDTEGWSKRERLDSELKPKGVRAYRSRNVE